MTTTHGPVTDIDYGAMIRALNQVHYAGETSFYEVAPLRPCELSLYQGLPANSRVLDVGCGAGRVTNAITELGGNIIGVDLNDAALAAGRRACPQATFIHGNMTDLPLSSDAFDRVWCLRFSFNALPTETDRRATVRELWRVCAPGGTVLVETFNWYFTGRWGLIRVANLLERASRAVRWRGQGRVGSAPIPARDIIYLANKAESAAPGYAHLTTAEELTELADACGLGAHAWVTSERDLLSGRMAPVRRRHGRYAMWLVLQKPVTRP